MLITLNKKSLNEIKANIKKIQQQIKNEIIPNFLKECCYKIQEMANENLSLVDIGANVKLDIMAGWNEPIITKTKAILTNSADKAVYVEFGVGIGGKSSPHDNANKAGYEYDVDSFAKNADRSWFFSSSLSDLDIPLENVEQLAGNDNQMIFQSWGAPATMFVYNAMMDFANNQIAKTLWEKTLKKYWG